MTFNRSEFPAITEEEEQLILNHKWIEAIKSYRRRSAERPVQMCTYTSDDGDFSCLGNNCPGHHSTYMSYEMGLYDAKQVMLFERDRLFKDRTLSPEVHENLAHNVRNELKGMTESLANQIGVTRAHVLDVILREATQLKG